MNTTLNAKLDRDKFFVNQKHRAWMKSKYYVFDDGGRPLFYVERPVRPLRRADITIYEDDGRTSPFMYIRQDHGFAALKRMYTLFEHGSDEPIALFQRDNIASLLRRAWKISDGAGTLVAWAREDSAAIAAARRVLEFVPIVGGFVGLVRTNFRLHVVSAGGLDVQVGTFNRKLSIGDKYVLDLTSDAARLLDRRVALALGILLDTGEAR